MGEAKRKRDKPKWWHGCDPEAMRGFAGNSGPFDFYLFNNVTLMRALMEGRNVANEMKIVEMRSRRIFDKNEPPYLCFTCDYAFVGHIPDVMGYAKRCLGNEALTMPFCPACAKLSIDELKQRILARLGTYELTRGHA
jgi:hypothetical protein